MSKTVFEELRAMMVDQNSREEAIGMLARLGFVPVSQGAGARVDLAAAEERGRQKARKRSVEIAKLCVEAGCKEMLPSVISESATVEQACRRINLARPKA